MTLRVVIRETRLPMSAESVWEWHMRPGALERLLPPWSGVRVVHHEGTIANSGRVELSVPGWGRRWRWDARHEIVTPGSAFADIQERGPFRHWRHTHRIRADGEGCILEDQVEFAPPGGALGMAMIAARVEADLERLTKWRRKRLIDDLGCHRSAIHQPRQTVAISGARGLLGSALGSFLGGGGHQVRPLVRGGKGGADGKKMHGIAWEPGRSVDTDALAACDTLIHLAGANVADRRWTPAVKSQLWSSRVDATRHLCEAMAAAPKRPKTLICASGIGIYGLRRHEPVKEDSSAGDDFLAELCTAWEAACEPARAAGIRVVHLRLGVVLSGAGGALMKMTPAVRWGVAGPVAGGKQALPWIALDDAIGAIHHLMMDASVSGPVNLVSPEPTTNKGLIRAIGRIVHRPTLIPLPAFAVRLLFGEMGEATLLADCHALPGRLLAEGFAWRHRDLDQWLRFELRG
jgi:uncharacterized protein